eukprot:TRINITY_DN35409_c0_g1_i2.p2 TRINITY_DN35409_c0_g1~~TRINITY_DN35409_c0_g1_i2.p2  ORF type:complete len:178 (-),score=50.08 TRINITY_DN35409_c0_g1_i2:56-589(-)
MVQGAPRTTAELFAGRRCMLVSVPGAFTTICDAVHLPGFVDKAHEFKQRGLDPVFVAVNDSAVMEAWGEVHGAGGKVELVGDGNGELTRALGLLVDMSVKGMGSRGKRAAMIVDDLVVTWLVIDTLCEFRSTRVESVLEDLYAVCLLYTSDAADEEDSVDLGGRRIIKKKKSRHRTP